MLPHQPLLEQQFPKDDPKQVNPVVPPQVASVETFFVGVEAAADDERVEVRTINVELAGFEEDTGLLPLQVPNSDWQPVEQCAVLDPHYYCQQENNIECMLHTQPY